MDEDDLHEPFVISSSPVRTWFNLLAVAIVLVLLASILVPMILKARVAARRTQSKNNLKQIGLALHNYHDVYSQLPIGWDTDTAGKTKHGPWTRIVPHLFSSPIFSHVNFDYEWNHPTNEWIYLSHSIHLNNPAVSQTQTGDGFFVAHYAFNQQLMNQNSSLSLQDLTKPQDQIWLAGEVREHFVPWGYPWQSRNADCPLNSTSESFGSPSADGAFVAMIDGSVRWIANDSSNQSSPNTAADQTLNATSFRSPPYPAQFSEEGSRPSIHIHQSGKGSAKLSSLEITRAAKSAIKETPNAQTLVALNWNPTESDIELLQTLKQLHYLVISNPATPAATDKLLALKQLRTIVCDQRVIRDQSK